MEPTQSSETSAFNTETPGKYPEDNLSISELTQNATGHMFIHRKMPQGICLYITSFSLINYVQHYMLYTNVHTNNIELTELVGFVNKHFRLHRMKCPMESVCVPTTKPGNSVLEQWLREIFGLKTEELAGGEQNCIVRICMIGTG
jgi:hypothetical protein